VWGDGGNDDGLDVLLGRVTSRIVHVVEGIDRVVYGTRSLCTLSLILTHDKV
jgi:hypothetical protein